MEHQIQIQCGGSTRTNKISANNYIYKHTNTDDDDDDDDDDDIIHLPTYGLITSSHTRHYSHPIYE